MRSEPCYLAVSCAALFLLLLLQSTICTGAQLECYCSDCDRRICRTELGGACFIQLKEHNQTSERGCLDKATAVDICSQSSSSSSSSYSGERVVFCCNSHRCNRWSAANNREARISDNNKTGMESDIGSQTSTGQEESALTIVAIVSGALTTFFLIMAVSVSLSFFYCYCCHDRRRDRERTVDVESGESSPSPVASNGPVAFQPQGISLAKLSADTVHPFPSLQQRHIVQHTSLEKNLEKGRFCETHTGRWRRDKVLVKVFSEKTERVWFNESRIHQLPHMRHENIHCFYATDNPETASSLHLIVLEYHKHGSLYEYLQRTTLHSYNVVTFAVAIADGLAFLHSDLCNEHGKKPSIAHRNISSESIYVKYNGTCCISDFSLAVTSSDAFSSSDPTSPSLPSSGPTSSMSSSSSSTSGLEPDYRYLAPEFLAQPPAQDNMENLKKGDMYSYGLVLWEIARRCVVLGMVEDVCLPYSTFLQHSPVQKTEMRDLVVTQDLRPPVPDQWNRDETMRIILRTITECWHGNSTVRLTPQRVKKTLWKLSQQIQPKMYDKNGKPVTIERHTFSNEPFHQPVN